MTKMSLIKILLVLSVQKVKIKDKSCSLKTRWRKVFVNSLLQVCLCPNENGRKGEKKQKGILKAQPEINHLAQNFFE